LLKKSARRVKLKDSQVIFVGDSLVRPTKTIMIIIIIIIITIIVTLLPTANEYFRQGRPV